MKLVIRASLLVLATLAVYSLRPTGSAQAQGQQQVIALAPKPAELTPYVEPHRPHWSCPRSWRLTQRIRAGARRSSMMLT